MQDPRGYTVESGKQLTDRWSFTSGYDLAVRARYSTRPDEVVLELANRGTRRVDVAVSDRYSARSTKVSLRPGGTRTERWSLSRTRGWYDLTVTVREDPQFEHRYAGHVENGEDSISDPGMGGLV